MLVKHVFTCHVCDYQLLIQEARLSQRNRATLRVNEYFVNSLELGHSK